MSKFDPYEHLKIAPNPDGSITRLIKFPIIPANSDEDASSAATASKDVSLDDEKKTWLRIYRPAKLPSNDATVARLPIIIYFHNGAWFLISVANEASHKKCSDLAATVPAVVIAVDYRLAPEHRLPAPYEDAVDAVHWVKRQANDIKGDEWLKNYGDFSRCYLAGCSNGANIVFNAGLRVVDLDLDPVRIAGLVMNQPMFGGIKRTASEIENAADPLFPLPAMDLIWEMALPPGADRDHRYCNPMTEGPHREKLRSLAPSLVIGFNGDIILDRQQEFVTGLLSKGGVRVKAHFEEVGFHAIDTVDPRRAAIVLNNIKDFINGFSNM